MTIDKQYKLKDIAGEKVIILQGHHAIDMTKIISLNSTAEYLWNKFYDSSFELADVSEALVSEYDISKEIAENDAAEWCGKMLELGLICRS